ATEWWGVPNKASSAGVITITGEGPSTATCTGVAAFNWSVRPLAGAGVRSIRSVDRGVSRSHGGETCGHISRSNDGGTSGQFPGSDQLIVESGAETFVAASLASELPSSAVSFGHGTRDGACGGNGNCDPDSLNLSVVRFRTVASRGARYQHCRFVARSVR